MSAGTLTAQRNLQAYLDQLGADVIETDRMPSGFGGWYGRVSGEHVFIFPSGQDAATRLQYARGFIVRTERAA